MAKIKKPTPKEEKFTLLLFGGDSQRIAYRKVYTLSRKWTDNTVDVRASKLANTDKIIIRLKELQAEAQKNSQITHKEITDELARIAFFDIRTIFDEHGALKTISKLDETAAKAISSIKVTTKYVGRGKDKEPYDVIEVKLNDKGQSLDKLAKHVGYYEKDNKQLKPEIKLGLDDYYKKVNK